jgi:ZIP family zinc transporter
VSKHRARPADVHVFGIWITIAVASGASSLLGCAVFGDMPPFVVAVTTAVAAGAMLTMIVDTMIPEAVAETQDWAGLVALVLLVSATLTSLEV